MSSASTQPTNRVRFGTKAETLERLATRLTTARVLPQVRCDVCSWQADPAAVLAECERSGWLEKTLIVRSSSHLEDTPGASEAGRFPTVPNCRGVSALRQAFDTVAGALEDHDQIFVQPQIMNLGASGVLFTREPSGGGRYAILSLSRDPKRADRVTAGGPGAVETYYLHDSGPPPTDPEIARCLALARELAELLCEDALDIEWAIDGAGELYLLQARPLTVNDPEPVPPEEEARAVSRLATRIAGRSAPHPDLRGGPALFGSMPDWNPAEILGARPRPLAFSLYRELVTDGIWAYQRSNYGYRNLRGHPLVVSFGGLPYVDVRLSLHSFLPAELPDALAGRLVEEFSRRLIAAPELHDKVEFEIVHACATCRTDLELEPLGQRGFDATERGLFAAALRRLTNRLSAGPGALFRRDVARIEELERRAGCFEQQTRKLDPLARIHHLLEDIARYGTLPFAGIARAAFVAVQQLDSLVKAGLFTSGDKQRFLRSLHTVGSRFEQDLASLPREDLLERYGHLRPGTYEITSPRYDEEPARFLARPSDPPRPTPPAFEPAPQQARELKDLLAREGLEHDTASLLRFFREAIEGREQAKFVFTRSLSRLLVELERFGALHGFSREELSFTEIGVVRQLFSNGDDPREVLSESIRRGRERYALTRRLTLPPLITTPAAAFAFDVPDATPSFVTRGEVTGPVVARLDRNTDLQGAIVLIESADPGYDWIFARGIAGFVTRYGGTNSHMAIRAGELGLPAVLGAGGRRFRAWSRAGRLRIDAGNRLVEILT